MYKSFFVMIIYTNFCIKAMNVISEKRCKMSVAFFNRFSLETVDKGLIIPLKYNLFSRHPQVSEVSDSENKSSSINKAIFFYTVLEVL